MMSNSKSFKYATLLTAMYCVVLCCGDLLATRLTLINGIEISAGSFVISMAYILANIVTEVYGYSYGRQLIWLGMLAEIVFAFIVQGLNLFPAPPYWHAKSQYDIVFSPLIGTAISYCFANFMGIFLNIFILSKWKILARGKFFIIRNITSNIIGEFTYVTLIYIFLFKVFGHLPMQKILTLVLTSMSSKILFGLLASIPTPFIVSLLKKVEGVDIYDVDIKFTPFKFTNN